MKLRKPVADDAAVKKCDDAIGVLRHIVVMCDEHDGLVEIACERANHIHHFGFGFGIEIAGRLVGEYHLRTCHESAGDADALLLTARHLGRIMVHAFAKADPLEHGTRDRLAFTLRHASEHQWHGHILDGIEIGQQIVRLEHEAKVLLPEFGQLPFVKPADGHTCDTYTTFSWFFHAGKLIEQGGFTGSGLAIDTANLPLRNGEIDTFQCYDGLIEHWIFLA